MADGDQAPAVGDFYGPFFQVKFFTLIVEPTALQRRITGLGAVVATIVAGQKAAGLTIAGAQEGVENISGDSSIEQHIPNIAASLTAESKAGSPYRFVLTLTPEYGDGLVILNSSLFTYATIAAVSWGYTSLTGESVVSDRHLYRNIYPKATFGDNISITIEGYDVVSSYATHNTSRKLWKRARYPTDWDIIRELVERNKPYKMEHASADEAAVGDSLSGSNLVKRQTEAVTQRVTDLAFIQFLLRRSGGITFAFVGTTFKLINLVKPDSENFRVAYTFKYRRALTEPNDIPIYSVTCNYLPIYFQPAAARGLLSINYDDERGSSRADTVNTSDVPNREPTDAAPNSTTTGSYKQLMGRNAEAIITSDDSGGPVTAAPSDSPEGDETGSIIPHPARTEENAVDQRALTLAKEAGIMSAPLVKLKCPGVPHMFPGRIVRLRGCTDIFDNLYIVHAVRHSVSTSGYDMDVDLMRYSAVSATTVGPPQEKGKVVDPDGGGETPTNGLGGGRYDDIDPSPVLQ